ncbi:5-deoxy-glucuronate isomerase [Cohnella soli]|uniref:5-deoxy-glucuronate isomerase n=1 Tax=Cohnella soli TaxID=425005 RepID=A0ABW0HS88_9BACL
MAESLIVSPQRTTDTDAGRLVITPESAGWEYVGFERVLLKPGERLDRPTGDNEICLVLLAGKADVATEHATWPNIGSRMNVFEQTPPYSVYVPPQDEFGVTALTELQLAICSAPGKGSFPARVIAPEHVGVETRGTGSMERFIHNILPEQAEAESLLVVEVFTPGGHWSSYPPHKHDRDALPDESLLEETYYYQINPPHGFAVQRVYTDDESLNETLVVKHDQAVLVPRGYHPVSAPPGYDAYYLNVMAGPRRTWKFHVETQHEWLMPKPRRMD